MTRRGGIGPRLGITPLDPATALLSSRTEGSGIGGFQVKLSPTPNTFSKGRDKVIISTGRLSFFRREKIMQTAEIFCADGTQAVKLPEGFHFAGGAVSIRREGEAVILEPLKPPAWPPGFFDRIRIDDPAFGRPDQGHVPPVPSLD